jgi:hypothetical protein
MRPYTSSSERGHPDEHAPWQLTRDARGLRQTETVKGDDMTTSSTTPRQRADELLHEMTIEEKAMQLSAVVPFSLLGPCGCREPWHSL